MDAKSCTYFKIAANDCFLSALFLISSGLPCNYANIQQSHCTRKRQRIASYNLLSLLFFGLSKVIC